MDAAERIASRNPQPGVGAGVVGAALEAARRKANLTQVELAALLGKPQSVVSGYENGRRRVDVVEFLLIVRTIGADPVKIFAEIVRSLTRRF
jgi:transcriptional regulator with XRE-family HTH domain